MIRIVSKPGCTYCERAKQFMADLGARYDLETLNPEDHEAYAVRRDQLVAETGHRTFPFIYLGTEFLGGFQELVAAHATGRLETAYKKEGLAIREPEF